MAHCRADQIADLESVLDEIRKLPAIKEPKPGIFYYKSKGFLHFHTDGQRRWADIRDGKNWGSEVELPFSAPKKVLVEFLKEVRARHQRTVAAA